MSLISSLIVSLCDELKACLVAKSLQFLFISFEQMILRYLKNLGMWEKLATCFLPLTLKCELTSVRLFFS